jgi:lysylphosphatidylglycerol synthetase-like protein (DUF2156 family)
MSEASTTELTDPEPPGRVAGAAAWTLALVRRVPFTASVVAVMLVLGVLTQTLWDGLQGRGLFSSVAYGLPAFSHGKLWTVVTGALFALEPAQYLPVAGGFALLVGFAELRMGTRRAAVATIGCQFVGIVGAALALWLLTSTTDWGWALRVSRNIDVGFSAGALGAFAAATAAVRRPWRGRLQFIVATYAVISFLYIGVLWDLEHLLGVGTGLLIGPLLMGRRLPLRVPRASRHEWRTLAAAAFLFGAVIRCVVYFIPADGPLGSAGSDDNTVSILITTFLSLLLVDGLRKGRRVAWRFGVGLSGFVVAVLSLGMALALTNPADNNLDLNGSDIPAFVVDAGLWVVQLGILLIGRRAFRSPSRRRLRKRGPLVGDDRELARTLLQRDGGTSLSWMTTWEGNHWYVPRDEHGEPGGYVAYQVHQGTALGLSDPIARTALERVGVLESYVNFWEAQGRVPCLFSVTQETADWATARGWQSLVVAEEAVIDLPDLEFKGKSWQDIRTALNRAGKESVEYRSGPLAQMPRGILSQVRAISEMWVGERELPEMGFTLGGVGEALDPEVVVGLAIDADHTVHGITSWLPAYDPDGVVVGRTLDVMRRLPEGFRPTTEFLIASACLEFKEQGCAYVSLSGAPLAHEPDEQSASTLDNLLGALGNALEPVYGFRSLESFKQKFKPRPNPLYLVFPDESHLPRIGLALTRAYVPNTSLHRLATLAVKARAGR